jgi:hypothetical protein
MLRTAALLLALTLVPGTRADDEPPVAGRPAGFAGAVGDYRITMSAEPTDVQAEDAVRLRVRIVGKGPLRGVARPDLRRLPRFAKSFHIDDDGERDLPAEKAREYVYRLRPRNAGVKEVPSLPFVFYKPGLVPAHLGYQTRSAPAIPLRVRPRAETPAASVEGEGDPSRPPDALLHVVRGPAVLRRDEPPPLLAWAAPALVVPPLLSLTWYLRWRRRHPDEARLLGLRRRAAARRALHALDRLPAKPSSAPPAADVLTEYLGERLDMPPGEATPEDVRACLHRVGASETLVEAVAGVFTARDAARFAAGFVPAEDDWPRTARHLILALEAEPWAR